MRKLSTDLIKSGSFTGSFSGSFYGFSPSSSYALTASYSINSISASYSLNSTTATNLSGGTVNAISITGSLLGTSSFANNAISSSFSSVSISSSYALTASNLIPIAQDLIPITGSTYSLGSPTNKWKDLYVSTGSIYIGETVLSTSGSTLFANSNPIVTLNTASGQIEVVGITASLSSSFATNANLLNNTSSTVFVTTGSNNFSGSQIVQGNITVIGSLIAQQYVVSSSVSYFTSSNFDGSTKFGDTDSDTHQFTGSLRSPNITGSLLGTASIALVALTSSYINVATNAVSSSFASTASVSVSSSYSSYAITSSYVLNSVSSSFTSTSSYSLNSVSSSYSNVANTATSATSANTATSSSFATTAGTATSATSATSANSANTANTATSSSFATTAGTATSATSANSATSASYALTASFALNSSGGGGGSGTVSGSVNYISKFTSGSAIGNSVIYETGSNIGIGTINPNAKLNINSSGSLVSGSVVFSVEGTQGSLFSVDDSLSGSLMSVNDISGLPILEVFSDDRLVVGTYNSNALVVTGSRVGIGTNNPIAKLQVSGNISGSSFTSSVSNGVGFLGTSSFAVTASFSLTASNVVTASYALNALTASFALNASGGGGGSGTVTGSLNYISKFTSTTTVGNSVMYETGSNIGIGTINPNAKLNINSSGSLVSGSVVFSVEGTQGSLFSVDDSLSGSLMSVNDISGLPILEVFSDDRLVVGTYNSNALVVTGSRVGIGTNNPIAKLQVNGNISGSSFTGSVFGTSSWSTNALSASYAPGGGTTLTTGSTYPITSSWSTNAISSSFATFAVSATSATSATSANTATSASYATVAGSATSATSATSANSANTATSASYSLSSSYSVNSTTATSSSFASTSSYNLNSISSSFSVNALTASYNLNSISSSYSLTASFSLNSGGGGTTLTTGSTYPITSSWANNVITASYALVAGSGGGSTPVVSVASLNNQTILYNFSSSQEATITGLTLTNNNWGINVVEEWNSGSGDIYFNSCSLLCHFDSINSDGRFIDNSVNNSVITSSGNVAVNNYIYKFGGGSAYFDGTTDYLTIPSSTNFGYGTGDFTIEFWLYLNSTGNQTLVSNLTNGSSTNPHLYYQNGAGIYYYTAAVNRIIGSSLNTGVWYHIALARSSNSTKLFINGTQSGATYTDTNNYGSTAPIAIGTYWSGGSPVTTDTLNGYMDEVRITKGVARYTANFTPQSFAFPNSATQTATKYIGLVGGINDSNVDYGVEKLSDGSLKIKKLTDTQQPSGSFLSSSVDRVYVNVLNYSNISVGSTLLGQAFTAVGSTSSYALSRSVVNPYEIVVAVDGAVQSFNNAYSVTSSTINFTENIPSGSLVDIRYLTTPNVNSASYALTASYALNGGSGGGSVSTGSIVNQTILYNVTTSQDNTITGLNLTGNKWDISVIEEWNSGSVIVDQYYNSCSLLMHFSGSNNSTVFIDDSPITKSFTVNGDSKISTAQSKFGSSSAYFDGTGDYLSTNSSNDFAFGTGDFTIEFWIYSSDVSSATQKGFLQTSDTAGGLKTSFTTGLIILQGANNNGAGLTGGLYANVVGTAFGSSTAVITTNTWYHIALVRNSGTSTLYVNGTSVGSGTTTGNCSGTYLSIGGYESTSFLYQGYLDELRITKGVARYTGSFSVPTTEFIVSLPQYATKYIGLIGGLNDSAVDYGVEKLSDSSLKIRKMTASGQPLSGSGTLSASVDRVYVNVLNYENAVITGSISNAVTASFAQTTPSGKSIALSFILG